MPTPNDEHKFNPQVAYYLTSAPHMYMHGHYGFMQMMQYVQELELLKQGVPYAQLGIGDRRHEGKKGMVLNTNKQGRLVVQTREDNIDWLLPQQPGSVAQVRIAGGMWDTSGASHTGMDYFADTLH